MNNITAKFENILDECLTGLLAEQTTLEDCLSKYPEHASELKGMLEMAGGIKQAVNIQPRAEFRERAKREFAQALAGAQPKKKFYNLPFTFGLQPVWAAAMSIAIVILLSSGGTAAIAQTSMPDSLLYSLKTLSENVRLALTFSDIDKAELHSALADRRVNEIAYLAGKGDSAGIEAVSVELNNHLFNISTLAAPQALTALIDVPALPQMERASAPDASPLPLVPSAPAPLPAAEMPPSEEDVAPEISMTQLTTPPATEPGTTLIAPTLKSAADSSMAESSPVGDDRRELSIKVSANAEANIARLRALLETEPENVHPAVRKAINIAEAGYAFAASALNKQ